MDYLRMNQNDPRWLQLEICREFQRNKCPRNATECKYCHVESGVEVQNGFVTACYDSIRSRCYREKPKCKYFHPPEHLKQQLLINGKKYLELKTAILKDIEMKQLNQIRTHTEPHVILPQFPFLQVNPFPVGRNVSLSQYGLLSPFIDRHLTPYFQGPNLQSQIKNIQLVNSLQEENILSPNAVFYKKPMEIIPPMFNTCTSSRLCFMNSMPNVSLLQ